MKEQEGRTIGREVRVICISTKRDMSRRNIVAEIAATNWEGNTKTTSWDMEDAEFIKMA